MKSTFLSLSASLLFFFASMTLQAQSSIKTKAEVFPKVLKTAEWAKFDYMKNVDMAQRGDYHAMKNLLDFSGTVDGVEAIQHATTCLELILEVSDETFASAVSVTQPKLKKILLDRLVLAQGRTKKTDLQKPIQEWAPLTWDALNGKMVVSCMKPSSELSEEEMNEKRAQKEKAQLESQGKQ
ncbi:MAG: hypothetical protein SFV22_06875 [Saprospiraceae bacterium]|nr:hypothetical protein [Saprospiraceae bacterium]